MIKKYIKLNAYYIEVRKTCDKYFEFDFNRNTENDLKIEINLQEQKFLRIHSINIVVVVRS